MSEDRIIPIAFYEIIDRRLWRKVKFGHGDTKMTKKYWRSSWFPNELLKRNDLLAKSWIDEIVSWRICSILRWNDCFLTVEKRRRSFSRFNIEKDWRWQREESLSRCPKKIDSIKAKWGHLTLELLQISRSIICFKCFSSILFKMRNFHGDEIESIAPVSNFELWQEWFSPNLSMLSKDFLFHSIRLTRKQVRCLICF